MSSYPIPNVITQHSRVERIMDVYSHLLTERIVYLGTVIDPGVANKLIAQLLHLEAESPEQEINLYINCEGGDLRRRRPARRRNRRPARRAATRTGGIASAGRTRPGGDPGPDPAGGRSCADARRTRGDPLRAHRPVRADPAGRHRPRPCPHGAGGAGVRDRRPHSGAADGRCWRVRFLSRLTAPHAAIASI